MTESTTKQDLLTVTATSRPKRVAVLFDPDKGTPAQVDSMVEQLMDCWGGGYHAIIATDGVSISADRWRLLRAVDPDVVVAVPETKEELLLAIERAVGPGSIRTLNERERADPHLWFSAPELSALGVEEIPRLLEASQPWGMQHHFLYVRDGMGDNQVRAFARRNFGLVRETVSTKQAFEGLNVETLPVEATDVAGLLNRFIERFGRITTTRDLARAFAARPYDLEYDASANAFHLVVGDTSRDLIYAWNRQLFSENWGGRDLLWVPSSIAGDDSMLALVGTFISRTYWNNQDKSGQVVSYSVDEGTLSAIGAKVSKSAGLYFRPSFLAPDGCPFPEARRRWPSRGLFQEPPLYIRERVVVNESKGLVPFVSPRFVTHRRGSSGGWMVDLDIEYRIDPPRYYNQADTWRLPQRPELGHDFVESSGLARIVAGGLPSVEVGANQQGIELRIPQKRAIFYRLLGSPYETPRPFRSAPRFRDFDTSAAGLRLEGLVGLFGGLVGAGDAFDDDYWRAIFTELAGGAERQTKPLVKRVEDLLVELSPNDVIESPEGRARVARRIVAKVQYFSPPTASMSYDTLRNRAKELDKSRGSDAGRPVRQLDESLLKQELASLQQSRVLVQGLLLACDHCGREDWWVTDQLARTLQCRGCLQPFSIPPNPTWEFRLNSLISDGIRKEGVQAVLHALYERAYSARECFLYIPCQDIYEERGGDRFTDLDLVAIADGKVIIGEAKSRPDAFSDVNFEKLRAVAEEIRPDLLVLAATGSELPDEVAKKIAAFAKDLEPLGTKVDALLFAW